MDVCVSFQRELAERQWLGSVYVFPGLTSNGLFLALTSGRRSPWMLYVGFQCELADSVDKYVDAKLFSTMQHMVCSGHPP